MVHDPRAACLNAVNLWQISWQKTSKEPANEVSHGETTGLRTFKNPHWSLGWLAKVNRHRNRWSQFQRARPTSWGDILRLLCKTCFGWGKHKMHSTGQGTSPLGKTHAERSLTSDQNNEAERRENHEVLIAIFRDCCQARSLCHFLSCLFPCLSSVAHPCSWICLCPPCGGQNFFGKGLSVGCGFLFLLRPFPFPLPLLEDKHFPFPFPEPLLLLVFSNPCAPFDSWHSQKQWTDPSCRRMPALPNQYRQHVLVGHLGHSACFGFPSWGFGAAFDVAIRESMASLRNCSGDLLTTCRTTSSCLRISAVLLFSSARLCSASVSMILR